MIVQRSPYGANGLPGSNIDANSKLKSCCICQDCGLIFSPRMLFLLHRSNSNRCQLKDFKNTQSSVEAKVLPLNVTVDIYRLRLEHLADYLGVG